MRDYYLEVSNNNFSVVGAQENSSTTNNGVVGWYRMPFNHPQTTYGTNWEYLLNDSLPGAPPGCRSWALSRQLAWLAFKKADSNVYYGQFDHSHYGQGGPGAVPGYVYAHFVIVVAGYEASYWTRPSNPTPNTWRHRWFLPGQGYASNDYCTCPFGMSSYMCVGTDTLGYLGNGYILIGEKAPDNTIIGQGLVAHEIGHDLGLPDLYDVDATSSTGGDGIGQWCLMAGGDWLGTPMGTRPGHLSAWAKKDKNWVSQTTLWNSNLLDTEIPAVESVPLIYRLNSYNQSTSKQYFLVENRQRKGFDDALPGIGLLIYHCDDSVINLYRGRVNNSVNTTVGYTNSLHYGVDVECQDGFPAGYLLDNLDVVSPFNRGDTGDPWIVTPYFDTTSTPNSKFYYGVTSNVAVKNISTTGGLRSDMSADLIVCPPGAGFAVVPTNINFGNVNVSSSKTDSVTVTNTGDAPLNISSIGSDNLRFNVNPTNANVNPAESKKFYITFSPTIATSESGNIEFTHNATTSPDTVTVNGTGIEGISGWAKKESIPIAFDLRAGKYVKDGGALTADENNIYVFHGNKSNKFLKYTPGAKGTWSFLETLPYGNKPTDPTKVNKKKVGKGAALCFDDDHTIYATKGNGTIEFWAYDMTSDAWTAKAFVSVPKALKGGTSIVYYDGKVYLLAGNQKKTDTANFFVYDVGTNAWSAKADLELGPNTKVWKDGSCLALLGSTIYALKGGDKLNFFYAYDISSNTWTASESIPRMDSLYGKWKKLTVKDGGAMTSGEGAIYALKGGGNNVFWKYGGGAWSRQESIPRLHKKSVPKTGAALTYADGRLYLLKGNNTREYWQYTPSTEKVTKVTPIIVNTLMSDQTFAGNKPIIDVIPNPFTNLTTIHYTVPVTGRTSLKLYNVAGILIEIITDEYLNAGTYTTTLSAKNLAQGIYFVRYENMTNRTEVKLIIQ
jgi:M6 family metalloprotease-like protein